MLSKEILEEQETIELPAREMMSLQFGNAGAGWLVVQQNNNNAQLGYFNLSEQENLISIG